MKYKIDQEKAGRRGFSLVEVLVVILVIGIIAGIGVPTISSITGSSQRATNERHAQLVVSMATNALHAGDESLITAGNKAAALALLNEGVQGEGAFESVVFRLSLDEKEQSMVLPFLDYQDGLLTLNPTAF